MTTNVPTTSTVEDSFRLQWNRCSIKDATGNRTATLKTETKTIRRTFAIDVNAHARATTAAMSRIVWTEIETSSLRRPVSLAPEEGSAALICSPYRFGRMTWMRILALDRLGFGRWQPVPDLHTRHGAEQQTEGGDVVGDALAAHHPELARADQDDRGEREERQGHAHQRGDCVRASCHTAPGRRERHHHHHIGVSREARGSGIPPQTLGIHSGGMLR